MAKQKALNLPLLLVLAVAAVIVLAILISMKKTNVAQPSTVIKETKQTVPVIQNADDLNMVADELDKTDFTEVDKEMSQFDADASSF